MPGGQLELPSIHLVVPTPGEPVASHPLDDLLVAPDRRAVVSAFFGGIEEGRSAADVIHMPVRVDDVSEGIVGCGREAVGGLLSEERVRRVDGQRRAAAPREADVAKAVEHGEAVTEALHSSVLLARYECLSEGGHA